MADRLGALLVWALFLITVWFWARPALIFLAGALIIGLILLGVTKKLQDAGDELAQSVHPEDEP